MKGDGKTIKVEKWDHNAVRIAIDDAAKKVRTIKVKIIMFSRIFTLK